jgi:hypothetical protein
MKKLIFIPLFVFSFCAYSQHVNDNWYFGDGAALSFSDGDPVDISGDNPMLCLDNSSTMSNANTGELLFYSNGYSIWNKNNEIMVNGDGLLGHNSGGNCAFGVKKPGNNSEYYLFTSDAWAGSNGLRYSVIDMSLDGGNGAVTSVKNEVLLSSATEKILAIPHSNNSDFWIIVHPWNSSVFQAYLLTSSGLSATPVESNIGSLHSGGAGLNYNAAGQIVASKQNNKIACSIFDMGHVEIFDFNNSNGELSNEIILQDSKAWGAAFSPSGDLLYVSHWGGPTNSEINQYDLNAGSASAISASVEVITGVTGSNANYKAGYLQIGPNDKIYIAKYLSSYIGSIENPDEIGTACGFINNSVYLGSGVCQAGLPCLANVKSNTVTIAAIETPSNSDSIKVYPNPTEDSFTLKFEEFQENALVEVYSLDGRLVYSKKCNGISSLVIDLSDEAAGYYTVSVVANSKISKTRLNKL